MAAVTLSLGYSASCDPSDPSCSPSALLLPHYSGVTHTPCNSQCSDSKQHPSYTHNAPLWEGGENGLICNMGNIKTIRSVYMEWIVRWICQWTEKRLLIMPLGVNFRVARWITALTWTQVGKKNITQFLFRNNTLYYSVLASDDILLYI